VKLNRLAWIAVPTAGLAAGVLAAALPFAANASTSHKTTAHQASSSVGVYDCVNQPQVRPGNFVVFCDGSFDLANLKWSQWNTTMATATGVEYVNNCTPNCAAGKFSHQPVDVIFWRSEPVKGHPGKYGYSRMTLLLPNQKGGSSYTQTPPGAFPGEH
jgi:hypothetical protein